MTTIQMQKHNKELVKQYSKGSFDNIINQLISDMEEYVQVPLVKESVSSTVRLKEDTLNRLEDLKIVPSESYECVILRLLLLSKDLNTNDE